MSSYGVVSDSTWRAHDTFLVAAVERMHERDAGLAEIFKTQPLSRDRLYAVWVEQDRAGRCPFDRITLDMIGRERKFHRQNCVMYSESYGRSFAAA